MNRYLLVLRVRGYESRDGKWNSIKTKKAFRRMLLKVTPTGFKPVTF